MIDLDYLWLSTHERLFDCETVVFGSADFDMIDVLGLQVCVSLVGIRSTCFESELLRG